ncbi:MAG: putative phospholipid-binding lipoprotein MlaA [Alphaproteobacteria bacterium MarineAlpha11_Bin1]|nr:MAG: putative phospholipid-binding lipoprotein MlaA [Alphaproteobacteria bacterium MarineAlpha11_Bin1]
MSVRGKFKNWAYSTFLSLACAGILLSGCATAPPPEDKEATAAFKEANDPYEPFNRAMWEFNLGLDKVILRPVTSVYLAIVPDPMQNSVHNFLQNLRGPVIFVNDLFQGDLDRAETTLLRFTMNSTIGVLGIFDVASELGYEGHDEDFGQTLAKGGVEPGPYLVLPIFGPSNPRDGVGLVADMLIDPFTWLTPLEFRIGRAMATAVDKRARNFDQINDMEKNSLDFYSAVRSLYRQKRRDEINNGAPMENNSVPGSLSVLPEDKPEDQQSEAAPIGQ